jgi:drug/metabolite transporter (DMT)-like permease
MGRSVMIDNRLRLVRIVEISAVWIALVAVFIIWPRATTLDALAVQIGVGVVVVAVVSVVATLALERRLPKLRNDLPPIGGRGTLALLAVYAGVFVALLMATKIAGLLDRALWVPYVGAAYVMSLARILVVR